MTEQTAQALQIKRFSPVSLPGILAPRRELLAAFDKAARAGFVYVCAPAGSGKSVSTALWLQDSAVQSAWINLDAYDNSLAVFYRQLAFALQSLQPDNAMLEVALQAEDFALSPVEHTIELTTLLRFENKPYALVLDDMHLIHSEEILRSLPLVLKRLPSNFVIVILSRHEPPEAWLPFIQDDNLLSHSKLSFTLEEIVSYLAHIGCSDVGEKSSLALSITDGWAMGVQAVAQSVANSETFNFEDSAHLLSHYFETSVWGVWSTEIQNFCLHTSIVSDFSVELAEALTGQQDARALLEQLTTFNAFISQLDTDRYRYHPLFLDFLRKRAANVSRTTIATLHRRAARYYRDAGDYPRALVAQIRSGNYKKLDILLYQILFGNRKETIAEHAEVLRSIFEQDLSQDAFAASPALYALSAWYHYLIGCSSRFEADLDAMYQSLPLIALKGRKFIEFAIAAYSTDYRTNILAKVEQFSRYQPYTRLFTKKGIGASVVSITHNMPYLHRSNIDFSVLATDNSSLEKLEGTFAVLLGQEWVYLKPCLAAGIFYEHNKLEQALEQVLEAERLFGSRGQRKEGLICILVLKHSILWRLGSIVNSPSQLSEARDTLAQLNDLVQGQAQFFLPNLSAYQTRLALYDSDKEAARAWLDSYFVLQSEQVGMLHAYRHFTTARAWMVLGKAKRAATYIEVLKQFGSQYQRPLDLCEALILQAVLLWATDKRDEAAAALTQALELLADFKDSSQTLGFIRIVADEGAAILPVLKRVIKNNAALSQGHSDAYSGVRSDARLSADSDAVASPLDALFLNEVLLATYAFAKVHSGVATNLSSRSTAGKLDRPIKLSKRQTQVLSLRAQGLNNTQVSALTGLAVPTVKTHLFYAYRKLEVSNAMDAVLRARELGLLPGANSI